MRFIFLVYYLLLSSLTYANDCPKWYPMPALDGLVVVIPLYDESITAPDLDCDELVDTVDPDIDGDGISNTVEIANGTNPNNSDTDGDGTSDGNDAFALNPSETTDTDGDGIGNNADLDDDGDGYSDVDEIAAGSNPLDANSIPPANAVPTASNFSLILDINKSTVISDWNVSANAMDADGDTLSASISAQGLYGTFVVTGDSLAYLKTTETNATDVGTLEISDGIDTVEITVSVESLYWLKISASLNHTMALKSDGTIWGWGGNFSGVLGDGTSIKRYSPTQESSASNWIDISAGREHTVAIKADGTLWSWGLNNYGQLGDGTNLVKYNPEQEDSNSTNWLSVDAGDYHTSAIKTDGTLWSWGANHQGQLGDGTQGSSAHKNMPVQEDSNSTNWTSVSAGGSHTVALKSSGELWAWGYNVHGQLGNGGTGSSNVPIQEYFNATDWESISAGSHHTVAIKSTGKLYAWGLNNLGQLGNGTTTNRHVPTQESTDSNWVQASAKGPTNFGQTLAIKTDGTLWAWGKNDSGQLGDSTTQDRTVPTQEVSNSTEWSSVSTGEKYTLALKSNGRVWAWGINEYGQLGDGTTDNKIIPTQETTAGTQWLKVSAGFTHTVALKTDGTLWSWGRNSLGELGIGVLSGDKKVPMQESTGSAWTDIKASIGYTVALKTDGTLWSWGQNTYGQLGDDTVVHKSTAVQESSGSTHWVSIDSKGSHTVALKDDGTLWSWGKNQSGQLGDGTTVSKRIPTREESNATNWASIAAGANHTVAIKTDGSLWAWGQNNIGQLGNGSTTPSTTALREASNATNWSSVSAGNLHTVALKTDGTLWAWGENSHGQLGDNTTTDKHTPTQEYSNSTDWETVDASYYNTLASKVDKSLWSWGSNGSGHIGDGSGTGKNVPTQEYYQYTDWTSSSVGVSHTSAIRDDGTLWSWGNADYGKLGTDSIRPKPSMSRE